MSERLGLQDFNAIPGEPGSERVALADFDPDVANERAIMREVDELVAEGVLVPLDAEPKHSWAPVNLTLTGSAAPSPPTLAGIAYPGRTHVWSGEPETLKSLTVLLIAHAVIRDGGCVAYVDLENGERETLSRLKALGLTDDEIDSGFIYLAPTDPMTDPVILADVEQLIAERRPALVAIDSYTGTLSLHGCDPDRGVDIERHARTVLQPLRAHGAAVVLLDHLVKDREKRGRYSIGSERKLGIADVHVGFEVVTAFSRGRSGLVRLRVHKDRPGYLTRPVVAELELASDTATGRITWRFKLAAESEPTASTPFRPTVLMQRVSEHLEVQDQPLSRSKVERSVTGNRPHLRTAMDCLIAEGYAIATVGPRDARLLTSVKAFRQDDPVPTTSTVDEDDPVPTPSTSGSLNHAVHPTPSNPVLTASITPPTDPVQPASLPSGEDAVAGRGHDDPDADEIERLAKETWGALDASIADVANVVHTHAREESS
jgi:AAA domain